jgi:predicted ribosome quality control (RQC) complex YloA/Tae2 family protein
VFRANVCVRGAAGWVQSGKQQEGKRGAAARAAAEMTGVRSFTAPSGSTVLVGRNNRGNETLTHDMASNHDLWFHVRGIPGSHTVSSFSLTFQRAYPG